MTFVGSTGIGIRPTSRLLISKCDSSSSSVSPHVDPDMVQILSVNIVYRYTKCFKKIMLASGRSCKSLPARSAMLRFVQVQSKS